MHKLGKRRIICTTRIVGDKQSFNPRILQTNSSNALVCFDLIELNHIKSWLIRLCISPWKASTTTTYFCVHFIIGLWTRPNCWTFFLSFDAQTFHVRISPASFLLSWRYCLSLFINLSRQKDIQYFMTKLNFIDGVHCSQSFELKH